MSRVLILYGTTDGHTRKVADVLAATFRDEGCRVEVVDAERAAPLQLDNYDGVIVTASIHIGGYQGSVRRWVRAHAAWLSRMPTAFLSVCLGILEQRPEAQREVERIMQNFLNQTGWQPTTTMPVAGAVPYTRYNWLKKLVMRPIVAKAGGDTDTSRDFEYTDWDALRAFARSFARAHELAYRPPVAAPQARV
jgi:menaquinone-dependent protoporphyrinogen oxidase